MGQVKPTSPAQTAADHLLFSERSPEIIRVVVLLSMTAAKSQAQTLNLANFQTVDSHAFFYSNGVMSDLGTLPGDVFSVGNAINASGEVAGYASTGQGGGGMQCLAHSDVIVLGV
jgi:hypothetical protein